MATKLNCPHIEAINGHFQDGRPKDFVCGMCGKPLTEAEYNQIGAAYLKIGQQAQKLRDQGRIAEANALPEILKVAKERYKLERERSAMEDRENAFKLKVTLLLPLLEDGGFDADNIAKSLLGSDPSAISGVLALPSTTTPTAPAQQQLSAPTQHQLARSVPPPPTPSRTAIATVPADKGLVRPVAAPTKITQANGEVLEIPAAPMPAQWVTAPMSAPYGEAAPPAQPAANEPTVIRQEDGQVYQIPAAPLPSHFR